MPIATSSLVSGQNRVETPFIIVKIGNYTFGNCSDMSSRSKLKTVMNVTFPDLMQEINITKINGTVNTYSIRMDYAVTENNDPNMLEKIFSSVSKTREIKITYGDWETPSYIYKEEVALITKISSNLDMQSSKITYTISCVSSALALKAGSKTFPARFDKPSDVIKGLFDDKSTGLDTIFKGMRNKTTTLFNNLIASDDKPVQIESKTMNVLDYIGYLVSCMESQNHVEGVIKDANYFFAVYDDINNEYGGEYFKIIKVSADVKYNLSYSTYEIDVGYPDGSYVNSFTINNDDTWSLLYDYSQEIQQPQYRYHIDKEGKIVSTESPSVTTSSKYNRTTQSDKTWWTQVTQFPISARIVIKGLLRPAILMSYLKINTYFYGKKHVSSGLYIITKQEDTINSSGYRTTLTLTRISGDTKYV